MKIFCGFGHFLPARSKMKTIRARNTPTVRISSMDLICVRVTGLTECVGGIPHCISL